jgi:hypothetical protein
VVVPAFSVNIFLLCTRSSILLTDVQEKMISDYAKETVKIINFFYSVEFTPFHFPPRGKGFVAPSPLWEGWEGGQKRIENAKC